MDPRKTERGDCGAWLTGQREGERPWGSPKLRNEGKKRVKDGRKDTYRHLIEN